MDTEKPKMPTIERFWYETGHGFWGHWSKVGKHTRRTGNTNYESPRIVLPREFEHYIGRSYLPFHTVMNINLFNKDEKRDCIMLVFKTEDEKTS